MFKYNDFKMDVLKRKVWPRLLHRNEKRLRGGLVFKAQRWLDHSTLGSKVMGKKKKER